MSSWMIKVLSFWYSKIVLRFLKDNEKTMYRNLERSILKLKKYKSHLMFNETCYNNNKWTIHSPCYFMLNTSTILLFKGIYYYNYLSELPKLLKRMGVRPASFDGAVLDAGVSTMQFSNPERGFMISQDGPLNMRMDQAKYLITYYWIAILP